MREQKHSIKIRAPRILFDAAAVDGYAKIYAYFSTIFFSSTNTVRGFPLIFCPRESLLTFLFCYVNSLGDLFHILYFDSIVLGALF